jgi:hypothetical protein
MTLVTHSIDWLLVVAEAEDGGYEPVALASTRQEAEDLARSDYACRLRLLEQDGTQDSARTSTASGPAGKAGTSPRVRSCSDPSLRPAAGQSPAASLFCRATASMRCSSSALCNSHSDRLT